MMLRPIVKWHGDRVIHELTGLVDKNVKLGAEILRDAVKSEAPVDSGDLQESVRVEKGEKPMQYVVVAGGDFASDKESKNVDYAGFVEFGTRFKNPNPFFRRGISKSKSKVADAISGKSRFVFRAVGTFVGRLFGLQR